MTPDDAPDFHQTLAAAMEVYGARAPSDTALRVWWAALAPYPWPLIERALGEHVAWCKFAPRPADIIERLTSADGRPTPEEAWNLAVQAQDEAETVVWTRESAEAWGIARPILELGDTVGARQAFVAAYARLVTEARRNLTPVAWSPSLGTDPTRRTAALLRAVELRQLPPAHARVLLPSPEEAGADAAAIRAVAGLIAGKASVAALPDAESRNARLFLAAIRAGLEGSSDERDEPGPEDYAAVERLEAERRVQDGDPAPGAWVQRSALEAERDRCA